MHQLATERNWAGNLAYQAAEVTYPTSVAELQELVANSPKVRALGSRHSFNDIADTPGTLVSLENLATDIHLDLEKMQVTVGAATRYGTLAAQLQQQELALHNLASLPHISIAGAVATGTHGSGDKNGNLATAVAALELVTADGSLIRLQRGDAEFAAAVVGLGALGIVTALTLDIQPTFNVAQHVFEQLPWTQVLQHFDAITAAGYSVSLFTDWSGETVAQAWVKRRPSADSEPWDHTKFYLGTPAVAAMHPLPGVDGSNCTEQLGVSGPWADRLAHFRMEFTPSKGEELQSEYLLPREHATEAIMALRGLSSVVTPLLFVSEIRTTAADQLWLSPSYERDSVALHFTWHRDQPAVEAVLPLIEEALAPFLARPHWGKLFHAGAAELAPLYPRFGDFIELADRMDAGGKFRNSFLERTVFNG